MSELPQLMLKPYRDGYNFTLGRTVRTTQYTNGMPRQRKEQAMPVHRVSATYKCTRSMYQYLMAFLSAYEAKPFLAYLLLDDADHRWYECRVVNDSFNVSTRGDQIFTVPLDLIVKPIPRNTDTDVTYIEIYNMADGQVDAYFNQLEKLVNEDLPDALGGLNA